MTEIKGSWFPSRGYTKRSVFEASFAQGTAVRKVRGRRRGWGAATTG
jgi:hypothetical protein